MCGRGGGGGGGGRGRRWRGAGAGAGAGARLWYSEFCLYIGKDYFLELRILNFTIFWGYDRPYFLGVNTR